MVFLSWNWKLSNYFNSKENSFFNRDISCHDVNRESERSLASLFRVSPLDGAKVHHSFFWSRPKSGLTSLNKRFTFFPKPNTTMSPVPKQDQSDQHLVCHHQMYCSQAFESHSEMLERKCFCVSVTISKRQSFTVRKSYLIWGSRQRAAHRAPRKLGFWNNDISVNLQFHWPIC